VVFVVGYGVIVTLDICELVMFPLMARLTVPPLAVVADTVNADGGGGGDGAGVGVGTAVGVGVTAGVGVGVDVGVNVAVMVWEASTLLKVYDDAAVTALPSTVKEAVE